MANEKDTQSFMPDKIAAVNSVVYISSDGVFTYSRNIFSKVRCLMDLASFPHDTQTCSLRFRSNVFTNDILKFQNVVIKLDHRVLESASQVIVGHDTFVGKQSYHGEFFSESVFEIQLRRKLNFFLYQVIAIFCF